MGAASAGKSSRRKMFYGLSVLTTLTLVFATILSNVGAQTGVNKVFMCYWGSWSHYRTGYAAFTAADIDATMCTHVIYSFTKINTVTSRMETDDPNLSNHPDDKPAGVHNMFRRTVALKERNPALKVLLAVGGASVLPKDFSDMSSSKLKRDAFVASVIEMLDLFGFDGLDMDWEYPTDDAEGRGGKPEDRENFSILLQELRAAFGTKYILTAAVVVGLESKLDKAYDVPSISRSVDYILIMAYDYHGAGWEDFIGHNSPLFSKEWETPGNRTYTASFSVEYYIQRGAPPGKLALGVPAYGRTYRLSSRDKHNFYDQHGGPGLNYGFGVGTINYFEICYNLLGDPNWEFHYDYEYYVPFVFNDTQWIGYDDEYSIMRKVDYTEEKELGGIMLWSLEMDDCKNLCGGWMSCPIAYTVKERMAHHKKIRDSQ